jgi:hypothetical protein
MGWSVILGLAVRRLLRNCIDRSATSKLKTPALKARRLRTPHKTAWEKGTVPVFAPPTIAAMVPAQKGGQSSADL